MNRAWGVPGVTNTSLPSPGVQNSWGIFANTANLSVDYGSCKHFLLTAQQQKLHLVIVWFYEHASLRRLLCKVPQASCPCEKTTSESDTEFLVASFFSWANYSDLNRGHPKVVI